MKKIRILHSNDIHADFFGNSSKGHGDILSLEQTLILNKDENSLYLIAGDVLTGSMIDIEYKGISSFDLLNYLSPDLMCVGNHEFDYGAAWPLLLEKVADFPLICANAYVQGTDKRLFKPYNVLKLNGLNIVVMGLLTQSTELKLKQQNADHLIEIKHTYGEEIQKVLSLEKLKNIDIDLSICLTHLGHEEDVELAHSLKKDCGIDIIIGGHSHTLMNEAALVNDIGCLDVTVNEVTNDIEEFQWKLLNTVDYVPKESTQLASKLSYYKSKIDEKYSKRLLTLEKPLTNEDRTNETSAGNFISDVLLHNIGLKNHIIFTHGGFTRKDFIDTEVTMKSVNESWPFTNGLSVINVQGKYLKKLLHKNLEHVGSQYFCCMSSNVKIVVKDAHLVTMSHDDEAIDDDSSYGLVFSTYTLDMLTSDSILDPLHCKNKKIIIPNSNKAIMDSISDDFKYSLENRIIYLS